MEKLCPSQSFDAFNAIASANLETESLLLWGEAEKKIGATWHAALDKGGVSDTVDDPPK